MVAPRQFCFDTLDGRGPRSARGPPEAIFQNGVHIGLQIGIQKWGPKWGPKMGSKLGFKMGSKNGSKNGVQIGIQKWGCHHYEQLPPPTKMKNHRFPFHLGQVAGRWGGAYGMGGKQTPYLSQPGRPQRGLADSRGAECSEAVRRKRPLF